MEKNVEKTHTANHSPITEVADQTYGQVLRVKADPPGISDEERRKKMKALAGAVAHGLRNFGEVQLRAIGMAAVYKAVKALIEARGFVAVHGYDLYTAPGYIMADDMVGKDEMTGIGFSVVSSASTTANSKSKIAIPE
jgi:stage V sporulation protein SpoVS